MLGSFTVSAVIGTNGLASVGGWIKTYIADPNTRESHIPLMPMEYPPTFKSSH